MNDFSMREGAVVMIDALGFRGIWRRCAESVVVAKLEELSRVTLEEANAVRDAARQDSTNIIEFVQPTFLSDTVIFGLAPKTLAAVNAGMEESGLAEFVTFDEEILAGEAVRVAAELVGTLMRRAITGVPAFAYRGAISYGRFGMTDRFVIGPAVDEAASYMNSAQGAFVLVTPSGARFPQAKVPSSISNLMHYPVPLKDGTVHETFAVLPFSGSENERERDLLVDPFRESFAGAEAGAADAVAAKERNTMLFLSAASRAIAAPREEMMRRAAVPLARCPVKEAEARRYRPLSRVRTVAREGARR